MLYSGGSPLMGQRMKRMRRVERGVSGQVGFGVVVGFPALGPLAIR